MITTNSQEVNQRSVALIGAGNWGRNLARNFNALGALHTLCDTDEATLASYGPDYEGVRKTTNLDEAFKNPAVEKVAIAVPPRTHYQMARAGLLAGKDVYVEKPLCLDVAQGEELLAIAERMGRVLMVGHLLQYHPHIEKLLALVAQGELGKLHYITSNRLNLGKIRREENALWSFAPHDISVILSLVAHQLPEQVRCVGGDYLNAGVADTTMTTMRFGNGVRAHIYVSWLNPFKEQKLTVVGSNGLAVFDDTRPWNEKLVLHRQYITWANGQVPTPSKARGEPVIAPESEPLRNECRHFLECCQQRRTPRTDAQEGLRVLRVLQSAQKSLEQDGEAISPISNLQSAGISGTPISHLLSPVSQPEYFVHPTAVVDEGAQIGTGTKIWHFCHIMKGAKIGERCVFGQNVNVAGGTIIGNNVKVQNNVSIYTGLVIEDDVFLGPSCVLTNVSNPRSQINRHSLYAKTIIKRGATIGANATIVCGVTIGRYAFVAAGSVLTKDVPDYGLMMGNPARPQGWMSRHGHRLKNPDKDGIMVCPESGYRYCVILDTHNMQRQDAKNSLVPTGSERLRCLDLDEQSPLPSPLSCGAKSYDGFKLKH